MEVERFKIYLSMQKLEDAFEKIQINTKLINETTNEYEDNDSNENEPNYISCNSKVIFSEDESEDNEEYLTTLENEDVSAISVSSECDELRYECNRPPHLRSLRIVFDLPLYPLSEGVKAAEVLNFSTTSLRENHTEIIKTFLDDSKIKKDNIHIVYKMLLEMEDITCMSEYVSVAQKGVKLNPTNKAKQYWITLKNCPNIEDIVTPLLDEAVLIPESSRRISESIPLKHKTDILLPHKHESKNNLYRRLIATVLKISKDRAYICFRRNKKFSANARETLLNSKYDIIFRSHRYPIRYQHHAINLLSLDSKIREYLTPTESPHKESIYESQLKIHNDKSLNLLNTSIATNKEQYDAVRYITEGLNSNAPFVVFGPPGTGKTTTIVEAILQLRLQNSRNNILVTAGSNSACDTIALKICQHLKKEYRLEQLEMNENHKTIIRIYSKSIIHKGLLKLIDPELLKHSNCKNGFHHYPPVEEIHQYGIIVATLCTVGKLITGDVGGFSFFTHIFMDEAGASTLPESLVGIMGIKSGSNCRLILSGDHKQLGPILKSDRAAQLGLKQSLMEFLLSNKCYAVDANFNYDHTLQARLRRNYRSHPEIVRLYNHLYYNDELIAEAEAGDVNLAAKWCELPNPKFPIIFQAVHGITKKDNVSPSSFNNLEIQVVMWFLQRLLVDGINGKKVDQSDIGIITPYKLQNNRIQKRLQERQWHEVESGSVETFQGREKQIIIVSLVKSFTTLGFLNNPKRLNVLMSRPKSLLILIGNPLTLRHNSDFAFIMDECKKHGTFLRKKKIKNDNNLSSLFYRKLKFK